MDGELVCVWLGDRSGWTDVRLAELDRSSFVDRSAGSWIGALVRGSEWIGALVCGSELVLSFSLCCCAWIVARCVVVCAFVLCFSSLFLSVLLCVESDPEMN